MIWRLTYCNKKGVEARIDIIKGNRTPVEVVHGSGEPFTMSYRLDKTDKSGHIMTSSADIEIFETETFNIDDLKTSSETELKVEYFEDNVLTWVGFVLPDFFSREIGSPNIVRMTASDRLTALKGVTLSDLPTKVSLRSLIELSLAQTGLSLGLVSQIQINQGSTNILDSEILSQRLTDVRGRSISCYDILMSIMVGTNSTIRQRVGQWQVYNKLEHELRTPTIFFDKVERGAIRTIQPVASSVGVYQEHGGGLNYPTNYDFSDNLNGWSAINGFVASINNRQVDVYSFSGGTYIPSYKEVGDSNYVVNRYNNLFVDTSSPYLKSNTIEVIYPTEKSFNIEVEVNATNVMLAATNTVVDFAIIIEGNGNTLSMDGSGLFNEVTGGKPFIHRLLFPKAMPIGGGFISKAATASKKVKGLAISPDENFEGYTAHIRIYGSGGSYQSLIHSVTLTFSSTNDVPKGNIFKTTQGSNFTKLHDVETTVFGDYITNGLNGYFYNYPIDDTSNLYLPSGDLSSPTWITVFDTTERPLLHHVSRQKSRLFSVAHDILKANINVESFDPLAVFEDCKGGKYIVVSANFDFLRSEVNVDLEQIAYDNTILKRDFIYSYFGEGEDSIKSIGGISSGGGGTGGGGMTSEQLEMLTNLADWWRLDAENDAIYSKKSVYSLKGVSALGLGSEGGGGGGDFSRLDAWVDYTEPKAGWVLSALLGYDLHTRVNDLEASGGGSNIDIATTGSGNAVTGVSLSGNTLTFAKSSIFALSTHNHTIAQVTGLQGALDGKEPSFIKNTAFNKNFGTASGTVAQGNDSRIINGQTAYSWGNHASAGYALTTHNHNGVYEPVFSKNTAFNKNFGTASGTVAQGNDSRIINGQTAYSWGNHASAGYALNSALTAHINKVDNPHAVTKSQVGLGNVDNVKQATKSEFDTHTGNSTIHITSTERTNWNDANSKKHTHSNKALLDLISQSNIDVLAKLSIVDGNIKVDTTLWATGGISALGLGSGGGSGGGGVDMLDAWANYTVAKANYYVPANLLVPFRSDTLSRLTSLESGSATSIATTGSGNAITSLTKAGSVITATKGLSFALSSHTHTIAQITGLQGALNLKASQSDITTAINGIEIGGRNLIREVDIMSLGSNASKGIDDFGQYIRFLTQNTESPRFTHIKYQDNTQYTLSIEASVETGSYLYWYFVYTDGSNSGMFSTISINTATPIIRRATSAINKTIDYISYTWASGGYRRIYNIKLEKGNKATDWSPAPEDQVSDWSTTDVTSLSYIKNKPTTLAGYGITDGVTTNTTQTITGAKTFSSLLTASAGTNTPKVDFGNGFTIEPSGTELVFKYNGVIKQRMLSTGTILATGGITALATT